MWVFVSCDVIYLVASGYGCSCGVVVGWVWGVCWGLIGWVGGLGDSWWCVAVALVVVG